MEQIDKTQLEKTKNSQNSLRISDGAAIILGAMKPTDGGKRAESGLMPQGLFVVQLHSDSDPSQRRLRGRVEHVISGQSERFASLRALLGFMSRYATAAMAPTSMVPKKEGLSEP